MRREDFPADIPDLDRILADCPRCWRTEGSCIAAPNDDWVIPPVAGTECLLVATLDRNEVQLERQNLDQAGHYFRPDVTRRVVDRRRQNLASFNA